MIPHFHNNFLPVRTVTTSPTFAVKLGLLAVSATKSQEALPKPISQCLFYDARLLEKLSDIPSVGMLTRVDNRRQQTRI